MKILIILFGLAFTSLAFAEFKDTKNSLWTESINYLESQAIIKGYDDGTFRPNQTINRAEFTKIVIGSLYEPADWKYQSSQCFSDINPEEWYAPYICLAKAEGLIEGYGDGTFRPAQNVNQAEALKILYEGFYQDIEETPGDWYQKYLDAAEYDGMLYFNKENPAATIINRSQMAYFTAWMLDEEGILSDEISYEEFYGENHEDTDFGWEKMAEEDCFPDEYYNQEEGLCYLLAAEFTHEDEDDYYDDQDFEKLNPNFHDQNTEEDQPHFLYSVNNDKIELLTDNSTGQLEIQDQSRHQIVWHRFIELIPKNYRSQITEFLVFANPEDDTAAFVSEVDASLKKWQLGVNLADTFGEDGLIFDHKEFDLTLIHEFAHVMTLNYNQVDPDKTEAQCAPQFFTGEGCARSNAFINVFFKKFWNRNLLAQAETDAQRTYEENSTKFVTEYAATNPGEDLAETFAYFIVKAKPKNCSQSISHTKMCFFYQHPSLVTLRKNIREKLK